MSAKQPLVLWGASGHAKVVADIVRLVDEYHIVGFLDSVNPERRGTQFCGASILGGDDQLQVLRKDGVQRIIIAFGDCAARLRAAETAKAHDFALASALHPRASIASDVQIGPGTVVAAGAVVNTGTTLGENVIINTAASVDHDCVIEDGVHVCPGANLAGSVRVGRGAWIGIGSCVIDHLEIGAGSYVGAGSVVVASLPDHVVAYGNPARVRRKAS